MQPTEAEHLQGYLLGKANEMKISVPVLEIIYTKLMLYEQKIAKGR